MNRFQTYLSLKRDARLLLEEARAQALKGEERRALLHTISAALSLLKAVNNFADVYFKPRKTRRAKK